MDLDFGQFTSFLQGHFSFGLSFLFWSFLRLTGRPSWPLGKNCQLSKAQKTKKSECVLLTMQQNTITHLEYSCMELWFRYGMAADVTVNLTAIWKRKLQKMFKVHDK